MSICSKGLKENESNLKEHLSSRPQESRINAVTFLPGCFHIPTGGSIGKLGTGPLDCLGMSKKWQVIAKMCHCLLQPGILITQGTLAINFIVLGRLPVQCHASQMETGQPPKAGSWVPDILKNHSINTHLFQEQPFCCKVSGGSLWKEVEQNAKLILIF